MGTLTVEESNAACSSIIASSFTPFSVVYVLYTILGV
jgi:hypothetical protein